MTNKLRELLSELEDNIHSRKPSIYTYQAFHKEGNSLVFDGEVFSRAEYEKLPIRYRHTGDISIRLDYNDESKGLIEYREYASYRDMRIIQKEIFNELCSTYNLTKRFSLYKYLSNREFMCYGGDFRDRVEELTRLKLFHLFR